MRIMKWVQVGLVLSIKIVVVLSTTDLLASRNGNLEADPITFWTPGGSTLASSTVHVHGGSRSAYISGRSQYWEGIEHTFTNDTLDLTVDNLYAFVGFIRLENLAPGQLYEEVEVMMEQKFYNTEVRGYYIISRSTHTPIGTWVEVGGDFKLVDNLERIRIYIQVTSKEVNYYFDTASLVELVPDPNWMANAEANINLYRKANLDVTVLNPENMNLNGYAIELVQDKSEFGHGTAIRTDLWTDPTYSYYPDTVYNILKAEWVTVENGLRWKNMEAVEGTIVFTDVDTALTDLRNNGVSVRGHYMISAVQANNPSWIQAINDSSTMLEKLNTRITGTVNLISGRIAAWNVLNDELHSDFMHSITNDADLTNILFSNISSADSSVDLFLNDYAAITLPTYTTAIKESAKRYREANVPIYGIGAQSHFTSSDIDITRLKYRLDKLGEAGIPIWLSELSIIESNVTAKTIVLEELLTLFFSQQKVEGVMLWGFWTGALDNGDKALASGSGTITLNAAGDKYVELVNTRWRTNWNKTLGSLSNESCFRGNYTLYVRQNGVTMASSIFSVIQDQVIVVSVASSGVNIYVGGDLTERFNSATICSPPALEILLVMLSIVVTSRGVY